MSDLKLSELGTKNKPLRCSSLGLLNCGLRFVINLMSESRHEEAVNTGTLFHVGVEEWVKTSSLAAANDAMNQAQERFREAGENVGDKTKAEKWVKLYIKDERNAPLGVWPENREIGRVCHVEQKVALTIPPAPFDSTESPIYVTGTLDQIRETEDNRLWVWDCKTSKMYNDRTPNDILHSYMMQVIAYAAGASQMLQETVRPGGIILARSYGARKEERKQVFYRISIPQSAIKLVLQSIAESVAHLRNGYISPTITTECAKCFVTTGPSECLVHLQNLGVE